MLDLNTHSAFARWTTKFVLCHSVIFLAISLVLFLWQCWVSWQSRVSWSWHVESIEIVVFCIAFLRFALVVVVHPTQFNFSTCTNLLYVDEFKRVKLWLEVLVVKQEEHPYG